MSGVDMAIENLKAQVGDLKQQFSEARKQGFDVSLPYLKFLNLPSKVGIVESTKSLQDVHQLSQLIAEVKADLESAKKSAEESTKRNDEGNYLQRAELLAKEAAEAMQKNNRERLMKIYIEIRGLYPFLPDEAKKEMYKRSLEIYHALQKA